MYNIYFTHELTIIHLVVDQLVLLTAQPSYALKRANFLRSPRKNNI